MKEKAKVIMKATDRAAEYSNEFLQRFIIAEVLFTILPIGVIALMRLLEGVPVEMERMSEWSFAAIILTGHAITTALKLKVKHQGDTSYRLFALVRMGILLLIASVLVFAYAVRAEDMGRAAPGPVVAQFVVFSLAAIFLGLGHLAIMDGNKERRKLADSLGRGRVVGHLNSSLEEAERSLVYADFALARLKAQKVEDRDPKLSDSIIEHRVEALSQRIMAIKEQANRLAKAVEESRLV